jgi:Sigma-70 region 2
MRRGTEIERLYDGHAQPLYAFLLNFTRNENDTRDLLQEIFVKLAREPKLLHGVRDERAFLIRLAHNAAIDLIRRRSTQERTKENFASERISPLARANDPESLDALAPQFIAKVPHDVIGGGPLHYRRTDDGQFVLYSVGWNETDDGGVAVLNKGSTANVDINEGDWVWRYPTKGD